MVKFLQHRDFVASGAVGERGLYTGDFRDARS